MVWIKLLRIHQYTKNLFIFLPLFFAGRITELNLLLNAFLGFILFCFMSSAVYIFNDLWDIREDKSHPTKRNRPIASGAVSKKQAVILMTVFMVISLGFSYFLSQGFFILLVWYLALNLAYSIKLKHISILDITVIAIGFLIRLIAGSSLTGVPLTIWIIFMTFLLALFISLAKRRDDVILASDEKKTRRNIDGYNFEFINAGMTVMASVMIVSYIFYTISPEIQEKFHTQYLYFTSLFVIVGILRYLQITFVENKSGSPTEILLKDVFLQVTIYSWLLTFLLIIY